MKPHQAVSANTPSCSHIHTWSMHPQTDEKCPQVSWNDRVPSLCFVKIGGIEADSKLNLPVLSLPSTSTKLLIHGVASHTGFITPTLSILLISCITSSFKSTRIGLQCVWLGLMLGSNCMWYGDLESIQYPQKHLGSFVKFAPCLLPTGELYLLVYGFDWTLLYLSCEQALSLSS